MDATSFLIEPSGLPAALAAGAVLIDTRNTDEFMQGHIPGAVPFSNYDVLVPDTSLDAMRAFAEAMVHRFSTAGVNNERQVIVYDDDTGKFAARELWILEYLGHRHARMLHGGLRQWKAEGGKVSADTDIATVRTKRLQLSVASGCFAGASEVARRVGSRNFSVIDVRNDREWAGNDETPCCERRGHIPYATHIEWTHFLENGRFKSPQAIIALLARHGLNPRHDLVPYSHRGARSANTYYALRLAGVAGARNFIGSWHEWSAHSDLPIER
jgi:thiosulfate/3-mercaptopyruvate sulfurtransferase